MHINRSRFFVYVRMLTSKVCGDIFVYARMLTSKICVDIFVYVRMLTSKLYGDSVHNSAHLRLPLHDTGHAIHPALIVRSPRVCGQKP